MKKFSNQQKLRWLALSTIPLLFLCYQLCISGTVAEYKRSKENQKINGLSDTTVLNTNILKQSEEQIEHLLSDYQLDTMQASRDLLSFVSDYCHDNRLKLSDYKPWKTFTSDSIQVLTRCITVEGDFISCLQLVYSLETQFPVGRVSSVLYQSYLNPNNKSLRLSCSIFIQNMI